MLLAELNCQQSNRIRKILTSRKLISEKKHQLLNSLFITIPAEGHNVK